jgi:hypothetical protein
MRRDIAIGAPELGKSSTKAMCARETHENDRRDATPVEPACNTSNGIASPMVNHRPRVEDGAMTFRQSTEEIGILPTVDSRRLGKTTQSIEDFAACGGIHGGQATHRSDLVLGPRDPAKSAARKPQNGLRFPEEPRRLR